MYPILLGLFLVVSSVVHAQGLNGPELLDRAIAHHDPNAEWDSFRGNLSVTMKTPDGGERASEITIDLPAQYFKLTATKEGIRSTQTLDRGHCTRSMDGSNAVSEQDAKEHGLTCERTHMMKDYYTYLYGLPMKLKDPGTIIDDKVRTRTFKGKEYFVLKVTYDEAVGNDTWYFYFDPLTYAMEVYQFFHDEAKNDGEYILLEGIEILSGMKIPKTRSWYYNSGDTYLGTDILTRASLLARE